LTFINDNGIANIRDWIMSTINNSVWAAYAVFRHPNDDHQAPCLSEEKQLELASFVMQYLGFLIHTHRMIMAWLVDKQQQLVDLPQNRQWLLCLQCIYPCISSISSMTQHVMPGDPCLTMLNGYGMSLITTGFDIGTSSIASNWTL
jgi:hypothetical protein